MPTGLTKVEHFKKGIELTNIVNTKRCSPKLTLQNKNNFHADFVPKDLINFDPPKMKLHN